MILNTLSELNPHILIRDINHKSFATYGKAVEGYDFSKIIAYMEDSTTIPEEGNTYLPSVAEMEADPVFGALQREFYGEMPAQIGYCNGRNSTLNGLEYHKCSEVNVAVTDMILLLGRVQDISSNTYDSSKVEAFYVSKGQAVELYATTLHFAPCKTSEEGFKCIVILPRDTNLPLIYKPTGSGEAQLLFMKNKWLLAHPDRKALIEKGAYPGIIGSNVVIKF